VVNIVRRKVADGLSLSEITELLCSHCLAPDTSSGAGIGCDNMTAMVVAILNGRTKEEWYSWIADRVARQVGYNTPSDLPQLYAPARLQAFESRQRARAEREERERANGSRQNNDGPISMLNNQLGGTLGGFARVLGSAGGISFHPGAGIISDTGTLMFDKYDSESDEDAEEGEEHTDASSFFGNSFGGGAGGGNMSLREQLAQLDDDGDAEMERKQDESAPAVDGTGPTRAETPMPPPVAAPDASASQPQKQLDHLPGGDEPTPAVKAEGLMDTSEDPLKA
jgi:protein phosphatase 2C family protein 2/3